MEGTERTSPSTSTAVPGSSPGSAVTSMCSPQRVLRTRHNSPLPLPPASVETTRAQVTKQSKDKDRGKIIKEDGSEEWIVEKILKRRVDESGKVFYRVKWVGWES